MILKKTKEGEFQGFFAFQPVPADFKSTRQMDRNVDIDAMHQVAFDVKQTYLRSIAAPGKRYGLEYILIEVYDHLVSNGPLQAFDTLDWIEGSEW